MTRAELVGFLRGHKLAIEASLAPDGRPQAAVVGIEVSDQLEIIFDTVTSSRKYQNLVHDSHTALVIGWDGGITAQIEGVVDFPKGNELHRIRDCYFVPYPDGRDRLTWPGITHVRVRPTWVRYSDFTVTPPRIVEMSGAELSR